MFRKVLTEVQYFSETSLEIAQSSPKSFFAFPSLEESQNKQDFFKACLLKSSISDKYLYIKGWEKTSKVFFNTMGFYN